MEVQILTRTDLEAFKEELIQEIKSVLGQPFTARKEILKSKDVCKMIGISPTTLQTLRINGTLPYSKVGGTLYYQFAEVMKVLQKNNKQNMKEVKNG